MLMQSLLNVAKGKGPCSLHCSDETTNTRVLEARSTTTIKTQKGEPIFEFGD